MLCIIIHQKVMGHVPLSSSGSYLIYTNCKKAGHLNSLGDRSRVTLDPQHTECP